MKKNSTITQILNKPSKKHGKSVKTAADALKKRQLCVQNLEKKYHSYIQKNIDKNISMFF